LPIHRPDKFITSCSCHIYRADRPDKSGNYNKNIILKIFPFKDSRFVVAQFMGPTDLIQKKRKKEKKKGSGAIYLCM